MNLYPRLLGEAFQDLPNAVRAFHDPNGMTVWAGEAHVTQGKGVMARMACRLFGFPRDGAAVPLVLTVIPEGSSEKWHRDFGGRVMSSVQFAKGALLIERLGPVLIKMRPVINGDRFSVQPVGWSLLGLPLPRALMPTSENFETETDGRFQFNVSIAAPLVGPIVAYRGYLEVSDV